MKYNTTHRKKAINKKNSRINKKFIHKFNRKTRGKLRKKLKGAGPTRWRIPRLRRRSNASLSAPELISQIPGPPDASWSNESINFPWSEHYLTLKQDEGKPEKINWVDHEGQIHRIYNEGEKSGMRRWVGPEGQIFTKLGGSNKYNRKTHRKI